MTEYSDPRQGSDLSIRSHDIDDSGNALVPGHRCKIIQGDNEIILDRALLDCIRQHLDDCSA